MAGSGARQNRRQRREALEQNLKKRERYQNTQETPPTAQKAPRLTHFHPRSEGQERLVEALNTSRLVLASGPAGSGKTLLAVHHAVSLLLSNQVEKLVLTRPAVESGEKIGFLPGSAREKLDPYLRPMFDAMSEVLGGGPRASQSIEKWIKEGIVEIAPLGFMRGRTFKNAFIIGDEMQNALYLHQKMLVTRIGEGSHMAILGDVEQSDVADGAGLIHLLDKCEKNGYPVIRMDLRDVQRDPIVAHVLQFL